MEIRVGFEITYAAVQPTPMVIMLSIHPSRYSDIVGTESIVAEPNVPIGFYRDSFGNVCGRLVAPSGGVTLRGTTLVRDSGLPDVGMPTAQQVAVSDAEPLLRDRQAHRSRLVAVRQPPARMAAGRSHHRVRAQPCHLRLR